MATITVSDSELLHTHFTVGVGTTSTVSESPITIIATGADLGSPHIQVGIDSHSTTNIDSESSPYSFASATFLSLIIIHLVFTVFIMVSFNHTFH